MAPATGQYLKADMITDYETEYREENSCRPIG